MQTEETTTETPATPKAEIAVVVALTAFAAIGVVQVGRFVNRKIKARKAAKVEETPIAAVPPVK